MAAPVRFLPSGRETSEEVLRTAVDAPTSLTAVRRTKRTPAKRKKGLRRIWPASLLLVSQRSQRVFSFLAPRCRPNSTRNAALPYFASTPKKKGRAGEG